MRSVPRAVATGSHYRDKQEVTRSNPVATALGTDLVTQLEFTSGAFICFPYAILNFVLIDSRKWRNWQTRQT